METASVDGVLTLIKSFYLASILKVKIQFGFNNRYLFANLQTVKKKKNPSLVSKCFKLISTCPSTHSYTHAYFWSGTSRQQLQHYPIKISIKISFAYRNCDQAQCTSIQSAYLILIYHIDACQCNQITSSAAFYVFKDILPKSFNTL